MSAIRDAKRRWDIDSLAGECAKHHPGCIPSSATSPSVKGEESSKEIQTLINYLIQQLEPFANEDKDLQIQMLQAKLAEKGPTPPSSSGSLPLTDSANMAQPAKRRRIVVKSDLTMHLFDMNYGTTDRPLAKKWWIGLQVKNQEGLQNVQAHADSILASLRQEQKAQLKDRACSLGLPFCNCR